LKISFGQLTETLCRLYKVTPERRSALVARLKYHQRESFPPNVDPGRGPRPAYGLEATFMLVFTFELSRLRIPSGEASRIVSSNWPVFQEMLLIGWAAHLEGREPGSKPHAHDVLDSPDSVDARLPGLDDGPYYAAILPDGLEDLRRADKAEGVPDTVQLVDQRTFWSWFRTPRSAPAVGIVFLDFERVIASALAEMLANELTSVAELRASFHDILAARHVG
jgi:hypothetical protein